ncbi:TrkH family potassium uptake protein [Nesterenkonia halotolerans]|uniref:Trk-type K+ transport system membrane component n=1 Tax=Nesterenkonia halotolerans TaxID=225325 RepID=A0ABR9J8D1_9MICC|nr:potassium transporter TrkG [Nesterenkonia halotolerans]MBE1515259.1 Trk-type K+ transport system membrane component [Nesterenkonia halotolerans]
MARDTRTERSSGNEGVLRARLRQGLRRLTGTSPARAAMMIFAVTIAVFASLLMMPWSTVAGRSPEFHDALFVATSAVTVTGLTSVNTADHWSFAGELVILIGIQVGGLGIITIAALLAISVTRNLGLRTRLVAQEGGISTGAMGETGQVIRTVVICSAVVEAALAMVLIPRFIHLEDDLASGVWHGLFYAISSFNNAGFVVHSGGLDGFGADPVVIWTIMAGVFLGSLGFPVLFMLWRNRWHVRRWSLHTKLTLQVTLLLLVVGALLYGIMEWSNTNTIGEMSVWEKVQNSLFASVNMRSGGFSVVESNMENSETMLISDALMFAGGGSASTAGGIKVTTIAVIWLAFLAEARGDAESTAHGRTIPASAVRVAVSVVAMGATLVLISTVWLMYITGLDMGRPLYESISAFATVGLTAGLSADLPPEGLYVLAALMFAGRVGIITFAASLTVRQRSRVRYRYPEGRPMIG